MFEADIIISGEKELERHTFINKWKQAEGLLSIITDKEEKDGSIIWSSEITFFDKELAEEYYQHLSSNLRKDDVNPTLEFMPPATIKTTHLHVFVIGFMILAAYDELYRIPKEELVKLKESFNDCRFPNPFEVSKESIPVKPPSLQKDKERKSAAYSPNIYTMQVTNTSKSKWDYTNSYLYICNAEKGHGIKSLLHSKELRGGETERESTLQYVITFFNKKSAQKLYNALLDCIKLYAADWGPLHEDFLLQRPSPITVKVFNFPIFKAAFTVLASDESYGMTKKDLNFFRKNTLLTALPSPFDVKPDEPGWLVHRKGDKYWEMSTNLDEHENKLKPVTPTAPSSFFKPAWLSKFEEKKELKKINIEKLDHLVQNLDLNSFLQLFTTDQDLINSAKAVNFYGFLQINFSAEFDKKKLTQLAESLEANGLSCLASKSGIVFHKISEIIAWFENQNILASQVK